MKGKDEDDSDEEQFKEAKAPCEYFADCISRPIGKGIKVNYVVRQYVYTRQTTLRNRQKASLNILFPWIAGAYGERPFRKIAKSAKAKNNEGKTKKWKSDLIMNDGIVIHQGYRVNILKCATASRTRETSKQKDDIKDKKESARRQIIRHDECDKSPTPPAE